MTWRVFWTLVRLAVLARSLRTQLPRRRAAVYATIGFVALIPMMFMLYRLFHGIYLTLAVVDAGSLELAVTVVYAQLLSVLFGIVYTVTQVYLSEDIATLLPYPLPPWLMMSSRFVAMWATQLMTLAFFVLPALVAYALPQHSIGVWIEVLVLFFLIPVIPLTIAFFIVSVVMRVTNVRRLRGGLRFVSAVVFIAVYVGIRLGAHSQFAQQLSNGSALETLLAGPQGYLTMVTRVFPPSEWVIKAATLPLHNGGLTYWGFTALTMLLCALVILVVGPSLFYGGYIGGTEQSRQHTGAKVARHPAPRQTPVQACTNTARHKPLGQTRAMLVKELRTFFRSPTFSLNAFSFLAVIAITGISPAIGAHHAQVSHLGPRLGASLTGLIGALAVFVLGSSNAVAASSISREGPQFVLLKTLPLDMSSYVLAKWWFSNLFSAFACVLVLVGEVFVFHWRWQSWMLSVVLGGLACMGYNAIGLHIDLRFPRLDWTSEQMAIRGLKVFGALLGEYATAAVCVGLTVLWVGVLHAPWWLLDIVLLCLLSAFAITAVRTLTRSAVRLLTAIE